MSTLAAKYGSSAITETQAAQELGVEAEDIRSMVKAGKLRSISLCGGKIIRIAVDQLDRLLATIAAKLRMTTEMRPTGLRRLRKPLNPVLPRVIMPHTSTVCSGNSRRRMRKICWHIQAY